MNFLPDYLLDLAVVLVLLAAFWQFRTPHGARRGNITAAAVLTCALILVLVRHPILNPAMVVTAAIVGSAFGYLVAMKINMLQIPAMVAFQHGAGGIAVFLVSYVELARGGGQMALLNETSGLIGTIIGAATFSGSMIAGGKLANLIKQTPVRLSGHGWWLLVNAAAIVALAVFQTEDRIGIRYDLFVLILLSISFGVLFAVRIGGADMPVLISFLNATAGLAAAFCGIVIENRLLIACGACVAASGSILTHVMCKAMNRSLPALFLPSAAKPAKAEKYQQEDAPPSAVLSPTPPPLARSMTLEEDLARVAEGLKRAARVVIIPGYGMAIAQAQFEVVSLAKKLIAMGKDVTFAIHPVAGRMPGHMNVLLAEADVDYELLHEMDDVNPTFSQTDLALVIGACDVVNPSAIHVEGTPISGMPILLAHEAKQIAVCNLDARPGYSGVENPLYQNDNTIMLLGNAKKTMERIHEILG